ncbi:MAG: hypothetical protein UX17_C0006G0009 [Parcubacteria group bacterium GW2011_GWC2_45_7]|nr:MAG: hypothetical protein UX17_C0006G0009 [Parcubacteria group bacterium GW2011_GWC2_45_7]
MICSIGVLLPWRLRCIYSEALGWVAQFFYLNYFAILKFIVDELEKAKLEDSKKTDNGNG